MKQKIVTTIQNIEQQFNVKVCFAVEAGSRAWGIPGEDSDYDVRFVYAHPKEWYLSIDEQRDVIELPSDDRLDINGWELRKALRLLKKANPHLLEWLHSGTVYFQTGSLIEKLKEIETKAFSPQSAIHHYLNMAKRNFQVYMQGEKVTIKKYFYVLRPILACKWIEMYNTFPPVEFPELVDKMLRPGPLKQELLAIMERKRAGQGLEQELKSLVIHDYVKTEIDRVQDYAKSMSEKREDITIQLNSIFQETIDEAWGLA